MCCCCCCCWECCSNGRNGCGCGGGGVDIIRGALVIVVVGVAVSRAVCFRLVAGDCAAQVGVVLLDVGALCACVECDRLCVRA